MGGWVTGTAIPWAVDKLADLGRAIIDGIKSGISTGIGALTEAIKDAAQAALNAAKDFLGISSPSRVMAERVGKPIVEGIANGIRDNLPVVVKAMRDVAKKVIEGNWLATAGSHMKGLFDMSGTLGSAGDAFLERLPQFSGMMGMAFDTGLHDRYSTQLAQQKEQLAFLQQQQSLLDMMDKYGLDPRTVIGNNALGLNADPAALLQTMTRMQESIIGRLSADVAARGRGDLVTSDPYGAGSATFNIPAINIYQQPGEDGERLADRVVERIRREQRLAAKR